jgi:hypothetical protein
LSTSQKNRLGRKDMSNFNERLQWIKRMPMKWRVLFGSQVIFFSMALNYRFSHITNARVQVKNQQEGESGKETSPVNQWTFTTYFTRSPTSGQPNEYRSVI